MMHFIVRKLIRRAAKRASYQILMGRRIDKDRPEAGRFLKHDVDEILDHTERNMDGLIPEARLEELPRRGNRLNVLLAVFTVAAYHAFLSAGVEKAYAMELLADIGWKVYTASLTPLKLIARCVSRNPQKQIDIMLRILLVFPFSSPGKPGYECTSWSEPNCFYTYWTHCPPFAFVRNYIEKHGDRGELEAFQRSWCRYDWAFTYAMVDGRYGVRGHYERPHTLSAGDDVCDMRWRAEVPPVDENN